VDSVHRKGRGQPYLHRDQVLSKKLRSFPRHRCPVQGDILTRQPPPWEPEAYKLIDRIAADEGRFSHNNEVIINTEVRSVEVNKKGLYFAFRDQGACLSLLAIKVYYKTCPEVTASFAKYPPTPTGKTEAAIEKTDGQCVTNAVPLDDAPFSFCKSDGSCPWMTPPSASASLTAAGSTARGAASAWRATRRTGPVRRRA